MKKSRRMLITALSMILLISLLLPGCTTQLPENLLPWTTPSWQAWEWQPVYNEGSPLNIHAVYNDPGTDKVTVNHAVKRNVLLTNLVVAV